VLLVATPCRRRAARASPDGHGKSPT
jgi:hypothetical protein